MAEVYLVKLPLDPGDDKSALVQVMAWWRQANVDPDLYCHMVLLGHNKLKLV